MPVCPVCRNIAYLSRWTLTDAEAISERPFRVAICEQCGLHVTLPLLTDTALRPWYHGNYHGVPGLEKYRLGNIASQAFMVIRLRLIRSFLNTAMTAVDYGAGAGQFVKALNQFGVRAFGIENDKFQDLPKSGDPVRGTVFPSFNKITQYGITPDIVTLWHVIEHLAEPHKELRSIHAALAPGGTVIISTPNIDSGQAVITGPNWYHLDPPRHRWHFSPKHLQRLMRDAGFEILDIRFFDLEFALFGWWQSLLNCIHFSSGFPLHYIKRGRCRFGDAYGYAKLVDTLTSFLAGGFLLPVSLCFTLVETSCSRGGSMMLIGRKTT